MSLHGVVVPAPKYISGTPETSARPSCSKILMTMTENVSYLQVAVTFK